MLMAIVKHYRSQSANGVKFWRVNNEMISGWNWIFM
jgi:hypothetical protein